MRYFYCAFFSLFLLSACVTSETTTTLNNPHAVAVDFDPVAAAQTRIELALLYLQTQQMAQAKDSLDKALQYQPNNAQALGVLAYYYQQVNDEKHAIAYYEKSLLLDPLNADTQHNYATLLCTQGDYQQAEQAFLKAINTPNYLQTAASYQNAAYCEEAAGDLIKAIDYATLALSYAPNKINLNLFLAKLNITVKKYQAAKSNLFTFQRHSEPTAESLWQWVRLSYAEGNKASVTKYGEQLTQLFPGTPQVLNYVNKKYYD